MDDIRLVSNGVNGFDWSLSNTGVETASNADSIRSAVIHTLLLHENELKQDLYDGKGSDLYNLLKLKATSETLEFINESIKLDILELPDVAFVECFTEGVEQGVLDLSIRVVLENGEEVLIDGI